MVESVLAEFTTPNEVAASNCLDGLRQPAGDLPVLSVVQ